jgi:hypothetical protein
MALLLPVGDEYSTVSESHRNLWVASNYAVIADKERICKWLFNAKRISIRQVSTDPSDLFDTTTYHDAGWTVGMTPITATTDPLPANELDGIEMRCPPINGNPNQFRWVPSVSEHTFYVFVYEGEWYWTPGSYITGQTVSTLGDSSYSYSGTFGSGTLTITVTIVDLFYL